jgi:type IV secretory pathway VirB3-like protein
MQFLNQGFFWDLGIYEKAVGVFNAGANPYELNGYLSFVYHPLVLRFMALFGNYLGIALMGAYLASLIFYISSLGSNRSWWLYSFLAFAYCGLGTISIGSGNVTVFFHLALLGLLLRNIRDEEAFGVRSNKLTVVFILTVVVFSLVKPYMLAYLLIPLVSTWKTAWQKSIWSFTLMAGGLLALTLLLSSLYFGAEFQSFLSAVQGQTIGKRDLGYGLVMYFYEYYLSAGSLIYRAFVLHFVILSALILIILFLGKRSGQLNAPRFALLLYFLLTILNPRLKVYDLFPALIALFIFASPLKQILTSKWLFVIAYALSLSQLVGTPLFAHTGILSDPLNVYYLTMGLVLIGLLPSLLSKPSYSLKN